MTAGATQRGSDNLPLGSVVTPGIAIPAALQGGVQSGPDANGVTTATVVIAHVATVILNLASAARATYTSGALAVGQYIELAFDIKVTALTGGTSPTVTFKLSRIGADGQLYQLYLPTAISAAGSFTASIGSGLTTNSSFGNSVQVDMVLTGAPTSITFSGSLIGK
jgi:hypothetical protein